MRIGIGKFSDYEEDSPIAWRILPSLLSYCLENNGRRAIGKYWRAEDQKGRQ